MSEIRVPVLIAGGGVTGLSSALFLAWHDVPCLLVERHPDLLIHPRARGLTPRTMEVYRQVGLEPAIREAAYGGAGFSWEPVQAGTLADEEYARPDEPDEDDGSSASPSAFGPVDQDRLEVLVRDRARELGADLRFSTELASFAQDGEGVSATITDRGTGEATTVRAEHLIVADGYGSPIRRDLGIEADGPGTLFHTITAIVTADLTPALRGRRVSIAYLQRPQPFTIMMAHDDAGRRWVFGTGYDPERESPDDFTDDRIAELVRAAAGLPDADVVAHPQIPGTGLKVLGFPIGAYVARDYRAGRAFLVGDAAHVVPPTGGLGANTGVQDAHNLAWKLAMVVHGRAGEDLLATYADERRPTGLVTMEQAMARFGARMGPGGGPELIDYGAVTLGYRYRSSAVPGVTDSGDRPLLPAELDGRPGTRAPHVAVVRDGREISTLDLYGRHFVLLAGAEGGAWIPAAAGSDIPVEAYRLGVDLVGESAAATEDLAAAHGIGAEGAALIRPDGFVAWRSAGRAADPAAELRRVLDAALSR